SPALVERNVLNACEAAAKFVQAGLCPLVPHLSHYVDLCCTEIVPYEVWMQQTLAWVEVCDALLYLGQSPGADRELARARELGIPIFSSVETAIEWARKE